MTANEPPMYDPDTIAACEHAVAFGLTVKDIEIIRCLAAGKPVAETAVLCDVSATTVYRRLRDPKFVVAFAASRSRMWLPDVERLRGQVSPSIQVLIDARDNPDTPTALRVKVAESLIELAVKINEKMELEPRLEALEAVLTERNENRRGY